MPIYVKVSYPGTTNTKVHKVQENTEVHFLDGQISFITDDDDYIVTIGNVVSISEAKPTENICLNLPDIIPS